VTDFNGSAFQAVIPGDRAHHFVLPLDRSTVPPKTLAAVEAVEKAVKAAATTREKKPHDLNAQRAAADAVRTAVHDLYDRAASTSRADRQHHEENYAYATAKFTRAIGEAQAALQMLADHALQADNPGGVGFKANERSTSPTVSRLRVIADTLTNMPAVPELG
jgi:uncharacterized membrane protein YqiK